ncbi:MAG TPA: LacI family DNA-binding transcriptional regulator [Kofleriaceae bacterium]|nr:LacI family DNA-binding transcriptional regulator [Kofleriaceae bacterium]
MPQLPRTARLAAARPSRPPGARPTMVDVAQRAGVSLKTVSRVVNSESGVAAETAERVQAAIEALSFRRHDGAAHLRRGSSTTSLGIVLMDVADPFYSLLTRAVEEVAVRHGFLVFAGSSDEDVARERQLALALCARRVDGLIVVPAGTDQRYLRAEVSAGIPVVFVDRPGAGLAADAVLVDNAGGVRAAVRHLAAHGHRRIAFLGDNPAIYTARERLRGFGQGMAAIGRPSDPRLVQMGPHTVESVRAALDRFRSERHPATALVTGNNRITVLALRALTSMRGWRPALIGFDDLELADLLRPSLTVIEQDASELGRIAAELLFARIAGDRRPIQRVVLPTRIVPRGSGELRR